MTRRKGWLRGTVTAAATVAALSAAVAAEPVTLRLRLEPGKTYRIRMTADQTILQTYQGRNLDMHQISGTGYRLAVKNVDSTGIATVQVTYDSVRWKQTGPTGTVEYDSQRRPIVTPPAARGFEALVGQSFTMQLSDAGRVTDLGGLDQLLERMVKAHELPPGRARENLTAALKGQFGDRAVRETMERILAIYPPRPVSVGDTWSKQFVATGGFPHIADNKWTLVGRKNGMAAIRVRSQIRANAQTSPLPMGLLRVNYRLSGSQEGMLQMKETTGWTQSATIRQSLSGTVRVTGGLKTPVNQSWPITVNSTIRLAMQ